MQYKYNILSRKKWLILFWCHPSKKILYLVPVIFLCLVCITVLSLDCLYSKGQSHLCPIFLNKRTASFDPLAYYSGDSTNIEFDRIFSSFAINNNFNSNNYELWDEKINVFELQRKINVENNKQTVWNKEKFGPTTNGTVIIVIQVYRNLKYLQVLLQSLERAKYIEHALLVFSHEFYSEAINKVVQSIQFTRVLQIYYPYGLQADPNTFPGFSPNDCPHGTIPEEIAKIKCQGHHRDVRSLQEKQNWWWKINMVFNGLRISRTFEGLVFFLEEDHYVFPDFIHVLRLMRDIAPEKCPNCNIFGLGFIPEYTTVEDYRDRANKVHVVQWNNMGFAVDRQFWSGLNSQRCSDMFCEYNDYSWEFTLAYLSHSCFPQHLKTLNVVSPRVFRIGDCVTNFHSKNCSAQRFLQQIHRLQRDVSQFLFPPTLIVSSTYYRQPMVDRHQGGWDNPSDIRLCKNISQLHR